MKKEIIGALLGIAISVNVSNAVEIKKEIVVDTPAIVAPLWEFSPYWGIDTQLIISTEEVGEFVIWIMDSENRNAINFKFNIEGGTLHFSVGSLIEDYIKRFPEKPKNAYLGRIVITSDINLDLLAIVGGVLIPVKKVSNFKYNLTPPPGLPGK